MDWVDKNHKCPMTNKPLERDDLYEQYAVKAAILQFLALNEQLNKGTVKLPA